MFARILFRLCGFRNFAAGQIVACGFEKEKEAARQLHTCLFLNSARTLWSRGFRCSFDALAELCARMTYPSGLVYDPNMLRKQGQGQKQPCKTNLETDMRSFLAEHSPT
jgi:hypothetical protein